MTAIEYRHLKRKKQERKRKGFLDTVNVWLYRGLSSVEVFVIPIEVDRKTTQ